jgi:hypothetical protein
MAKKAAADFTGQISRALTSAVTTKRLEEDAPKMPRRRRKKWTIQ